MRPALVSLTVAAFVCACGFQLRGAAAVDPALNPLQLTTVRQGSALLPPLRAALATAGVRLATEDAAAAARLHISRDEFVERVIAVTPQGRPREAEIAYHVEFRLVDADGTVLAGPVALHRQRAFAVSERDMLGKAREADTLRAALLDDMVAALVRRVAAADPNP